MLTCFYTFPPFRQAHHWLARRVLLCPSPPPPTPPITFLMIFSLSIILPWVLADVLKLILGISRTDVWSQASFLLSPPPGVHLREGELNRGRGLTWFRKDDGSLTTIFIWNYPPLPLKNQKISNNAGKGGREIWSVCHFVFFLHRRGGHLFLIGLCPKGSLIIKSGEAQEQEG